jgi:hypothetical protein
MRSLAAPAQPHPFKPGTVVTLRGMTNEALNDAYAKVESYVAKKEKKKGRTSAEPEIRVSLCGGHVHCQGVAKSVIEECVIRLEAYAFPCCVTRCRCSLLAYSSAHAVSAFARLR